MQGLSIEDGKPRTLVFSVTATTSIKRVNVKYLTSVLEMRIKGSSGGELYRSVIAVHSKGLHLQCCLLRFMAEAESLRSPSIAFFFLVHPALQCFWLTLDISRFSTGSLKCQFSVLDISVKGKQEEISSVMIVGSVL